MKKLQIKNISRHFGTVEAVRHFSLEVNDGELLAILGPSGCGKSTLLSCIAGIEIPDSGELYLNNRCIFSPDKKIDLPSNRRRIGFVFQNYALWPHMTVREHIAYPLKMLKMSGKRIRAEVDKNLSMIQLEQKAGRYPHEISGGEQQRVALGRALIMHPDLLLLDEPLSNLDARLRDTMQKEIRNIQQQLKLTVIHVTHDQAEAMAMADRIAVMNAGQLLQTGTPKEIYHNPQNTFTADFVGINNLIHGESASDGSILLDVESTDGSRMAIPAFLGKESPGKGEFVLAVRPEDVSMVRADELYALNASAMGSAAAGGLGTGIITHSVFRGAHVMYEITSGDTVLTALLHSNMDFSIGERVAFSFRKFVRVKEEGGLSPVSSFNRTIVRGPLQQRG
jgi:iron(III) transport system ATP-binding protein